MRIDLTVFERKLIPATVLLALIVAIALLHGQSLARELTPASDVTSKTQEKASAAQVIWQGVARIYLNPSTATGVYAGYPVDIKGIESALRNRSRNRFLERH